jgi:cytochrome c-type biogenesis protein CcmH/NrfF
MHGDSLTIGAHLLLWVFPLTLVVLVTVEHFLDSGNRESER